ncbi:MAG: alpha/beta hydrolase [Deltaproteobacteria bacterium]|nr:alpha/beta hydrolase [Deltaproteobacteria bacterium]
MSTGKCDPQIENLLRKMQEAGAPPTHTLSPVEARELRNPVTIEWGGPSIDFPGVSNRDIPGPAGDIPIRIYRPKGDGPFPALVYFHGGGWVIGNLDTHDNVCKDLAKKTICTVVSVDYRLSPEHKFPTAAEDAYAATRWVTENGPQIGVDPARIAVGGDSAGGNLATVVCLMARERGGPALVYQVLIYPVTDLSSADRKSYRDHGEGYILTTESMAYFRSHYIGQEEDTLHPHASPLLASDLKGLPPALILAAEIDILKDEGSEYAKRLQEAGIPTKYLCIDGMIHAFFNMAGVVGKAGDTHDLVAGELREAFHSEKTPK